MPDHAPHPFEAAQRQRSVLLRVARSAFVVLFTTVTLLYILGVGPGSANQTLYWPITLGVALGLAAVVILIDVLTPNKKISTVVSVVFGLLAAMLGTIAFGFIIDLFVTTYDITRADDVVLAIKVLIGIALAYLGTSIVLQTQDDFRLVIPYVEFAKQIRGTRPLLLDTSVLIDGRIIEVASLGLLQSPLVVPRFVIQELQTLADSGDKLRRMRGRRGLDSIARLQRSATTDVNVDDAPAAGEGVDQMLLDLARRNQAIILTTDTALVRVARIQALGVINLNDLASALKSSVVAGEPLTVALLRTGEQPGQAVGYLEDGTMVVVDGGAAAIGSTVTATITSTLQTSAGRLVFAKIPDSDSLPASQPPISDAATSTEPEANHAPVTHESPVDDSGISEQRVAPDRARGPFPPTPPRSLRAPNPRNPRR